MRMKMKFTLLLVLFTLGISNVRAQTAGVSDIGVGYFNGHTFATFGTLGSSSLPGALGTNNFSISFSTNTRSVYRFVSGYGPSLPANSGTFSTTVMELNYSSVPSTSNIVFTTPLEP